MPDDPNAVAVGNPGDAEHPGTVDAAICGAAARPVDAVALADADAVRVDGLPAAERNVPVGGVVAAGVLERQPFGLDHTRVLRKAEGDVRVRDLEAACLRRRGEHNQ